jgi:hypothetical protein
MEVDLMYTWHEDTVSAGMVMLHRGTTMHENALNAFRAIEKYIQENYHVL